MRSSRMLLYNRNLTTLGQAFLIEYLDLLVSYLVYFVSLIIKFMIGLVKDMSLTRPWFAVRTQAFK